MQNNDAKKIMIFNFPVKVVGHLDTGHMHKLKSVRHPDTGHMHNWTYAQIEFFGCNFLLGPLADLKPSLKPSGIN